MGQELIMQGCPIIHDMVNAQVYELTEAERDHWERHKPLIALSDLFGIGNAHKPRLSAKAKGQVNPKSPHHGACECS